MSKTIKQQIEDALWYLKKPGQSQEDENKAIEILSDIARGRKGGAALVETIEQAKPAFDTSGVPWGSLKGAELVIVIGHEPGGGAVGERTWNKKCAKHMKHILEIYGAKVFIYEHKLKSYGARQDAMAHWVRQNVPNCFIVWELHYDGYKPKPSAAGHHFKYRGAEKLAVFTQEEFSSRYPQSRPRFSNGIHHATSGNGAGFLRKAPAWALLTEPFFITNPAEKAFFKDRHGEVALVYCVAAARFAQYKGK